ncbi:hypothetical protein [Herbaspirillum sp.]|uniref:hypothetical protein n=1 Tax=Herbaspirillum sp. TaxID=1890675 RepID=UPI00258AF061|nr:hypothetical protein [Herbaspirillum sp.]MCP3949450.1 hypothetical protein [Herbaspirillum sp.]
MKTALAMTATLLGAMWLWSRGKYKLLLGIDHELRQDLDRLVAEIEQADGLIVAFDHHLTADEYNPEPLDVGGMWFVQSLIERNILKGRLTLGHGSTVSQCTIPDGVNVIGDGATVDGCAIGKLTKHGEEVRS